MRENYGARGLWRQLKNEAPHWNKLVPELPRLVHKILSDDAPARIERAIRDLEATQRRQTRIMLAIAIVLALMVVGLALRGV